MSFSVECNWMLIDDHAVSGFVGLLLKLCIWMSLPRILKSLGKFKGMDCVGNFSVECKWTRIGYHVV